MTLGDDWQQHLLSSAAELAPSQDARMALATAVAGSRARAGVLNEGNNAQRWSRVQTAVQQDEAFFVAVAPGLIVLDFDTPEAPGLAQSAYVRLLLAGHPPLLCASGQTGRRHVFCRISEEDLVAVIGAELLRAADGGARRSIRPPLARHRDGHSRSLLLAPLDPDEALARLNGSRVLRPLGSKARRLLRMSTVADRSAAIFSVALGGATAGWTVEDLGLVLTSSEVAFAGVFASRVVDRGREQVFEWLWRYVWPEAQARAASEAPTHQIGVDGEVLDATAWALSRRWPGKQGATGFATFLAMIEARARSGCNPFDLSQRRAEEWSGISSRDTVGRAMARLEQTHVGDDEPLVAARRRENPREALTHATTWRMSANLSGDFSITTETFELVLSANRHDAFRNATGLGKVTGLIYIQLLVRGMLDVPALVVLTGISRETVRQHLVSLATFGLAVEVDGEWSVTDRDLDAASKEMRSHGRGDEIAELNHRQRLARDLRVRTYDPRPVK